MFRQLVCFGLSAFVLYSCGGHEGTTPIDPTPEHVAPTPKPVPQPSGDRPLTGYEGYMILSDGGIAHIPSHFPTNVLRPPHLWLMDREGNIKEDLYRAMVMQEPLLDLCCETNLSVGSRYLAFMAQYDFSESLRRQGSRIILVDRQTLKYSKSVGVNIPNAKEGERVRQSFTLSDGSTYMSFGKNQSYLLNTENGSMSQLKGLPKSFVSGSGSYEDKGYFTVDDDPNIYLYRKGSDRAEALPISLSGGVKPISGIDSVALFVDNDGRYYLFSLKEEKVLAVFRTTERVGRRFYYDSETSDLYYTGDGIGDAIKRSLWRVHIDLSHRGEQTLKSQLYYRIAGRTESDSRQGYFLSIGYNPTTKLLYLSWLDQGRTGPAVQNRTKMVALPLSSDNVNLPVRAVKEYELKDTYDIRSICYLSPL